MRRTLEPAGDWIPNLAPMVDVIMVLLVFFLLGATLDLTQQGILKTELDPASGPGPGQAIPLDKLTLRIALADIAGGASAAIVVMDRRLPDGDFAALRDLLIAQRDAGFDTDNPVIIGAEQTVRWKHVVAAMDAAVQADFENIQFAVSFAPRASEP